MSSNNDQPTEGMQRLSKSIDPLAQIAFELSIINLRLDHIAKFQLEQSKVIMALTDILAQPNDALAEIAKALANLKS